MPTRLLLTLALLLPACASAQSIILPAHIAFTGDPTHTSADLLAYTHLTPGATSTPQQLQDAAQSLSDTGLFADVRFQSSGSTLTFALTPMSPEFVLPARYTNFPWWQPNELNDALKARVPLFNGSVPLKGNLEDKIIAALQALLAGQGVTNAQVVALPSTTPGKAPYAVAFSISSPDVLVHTVTLSNTNPTMQPRLTTVLDNLTNKPWEDKLTMRSISEALALAYRDQGYLDATVTTLTHTPPQVTPQAITLDFTATLAEGEPYHIAALTWPGSPIFSTADFDKTAKLHAGDLAASLPLRQSLMPLARAYYAKGFQDVKVRAPATTDPHTHLVTYLVDVVPGDQYRVRAIHTAGLSPEQQKDFDATWKMTAGQFYDVTYTNFFLVARNLPKSLVGYSGKWRAVADPNTHLVDLTLTFTKGGTLVEVH